jgi:hypothetical protein
MYLVYPENLVNPVKVDESPSGYPAFPDAG